MTKKIFALLAISYAMFIWYCAMQAGIPKNQDWAPIATLFYGNAGGFILFAIGLGTTFHYLKTCDPKNSPDDTSPNERTATILLLNAGWVLTALAVLTVAVLK